jgi:hypothetical protein
MCTRGVYPPVTIVTVVCALTATSKLVDMLYSNGDLGHPLINGVVRAFEPAPARSVVPCTIDNPMFVSDRALFNVIPNTPPPRGCALSKVPW